MLKAIDKPGRSKSTLARINEGRKAMGFPAAYQLPNRAKDAMHMLGNAVVPVVARDVIDALRRAA